MSDFQIAADVKACSVEGCLRRYRARGLCHKHYVHNLKHGDILSASGTAHGSAEKFLAEVVMLFDSNDCLTWPYRHTCKGYAQMRRGGKSARVNRVVCEARHGPPPTPKHQAAHTCGRAGCVNPAHLRWATQKENEADKVIHGTVGRKKTPSLLERGRI